MSLIKRLILVLVLLAACPGPDGKVDPYLTAHTIINQAQSALFLADGIFNQWVLNQQDVEKVKKAQAEYQKIRTAVANGLVLAHNAVDVAKQAKTDPDVAKLLQQADVAWKNLVKLLGDLLGSTGSGVVVGDDVAPMAKTPVKTTKNPLSYLPATLIP